MSDLDLEHDDLCYSESEGPEGEGEEEASPSNVAKVASVASPASRAGAKNSAGKGQKQPKQGQEKKKEQVRKRGGKVQWKDGKRLCTDCGRWIPIADFPEGKGSCTRDFNAMRVLRAMAKTKEDQDWLKDQIKDPKKLRRLLTGYSARCCTDRKKRAKRNAFSIVGYKEEVRRSEAILYDGVWEMMCSKQYVHWAGKPKNGGAGTENKNKTKQNKITWLGTSEIQLILCLWDETNH